VVTFLKALKVKYVISAVFVKNYAVLVAKYVK